MRILFSESFFADKLLLLLGTSDSVELVEFLLTLTLTTLKIAPLAETSATAHHHAAATSFERWATVLHSLREAILMLELSLHLVLTKLVSVPRLEIPWLIKLVWFELTAHLSLVARRLLAEVFGSLQKLDFFFNLLSLD